MNIKVKKSIISALMLPLFICAMVFTSTGSYAKEQPKPKVINVQIDYPQISFDKSVKDADVIATVEIHRKLRATQKAPYKTLYEAQLVQVFKGSMKKGAKLQFYQDGTTFVKVNDMSMLSNKEKVILFLKKDTGKTNTFHIVSGPANIYKLKTNKSMTFVFKQDQNDSLLSTIDIMETNLMFNEDIRSALFPIYKDANPSNRILGTFIEKDFVRVLNQYIAEAASPFIVNYKVNSVDTRLLASSAQLGLDIFKEQSTEQKQKNVIISPISLFTALNIALNGAEGPTQTQMKKVLGLESYSKDDLNKKMNDLINYANTSRGHGDPGETSIFNSLWIKNNFLIKDSFEMDAKKYYNSDTFRVDFSSTQAIKDMNNWISDKSKGLIKDPIDSLDKNTMLSIFNVLYFNGKWTSPFDTSKTAKEDFHLSSGSKIKIDMMNKEGIMNYYEDKTVKAGVFDYYNGSMMILIPQGNFDEYITKLDSAAIANYNKSMQRLQAFIKFPKFQLKTKSMLTDNIKKLGMTLAFDPKNADFSGISSNNEKLWISTVQQDCAIKVDEEGTEAAALTSVMKAGAALPPKTTKEFYVDKPFVFVIQGSGQMMLFVGKVENPLE